MASRYATGTKTETGGGLFFKSGYTPVKPRPNLRPHAGMFFRQRGIAESQAPYHKSNRLKKHNYTSMESSFNFGDNSSLFSGFGFGDESPSATDHETDGDAEECQSAAAKRSHRRTKECTELSERYEYRRAFSEVRMLEAMEHVRLEKGVTYNFITAGDVDSLTYLKIVLNQHSLDYLLLSTWCMAAEDILQLRMWYEEGRIRKMDMYVGEIFPNSYRIEWGMVRKFYSDHPEAGRAAVFRNHSKIYAGFNEEDGFFFGIQTSADINTNPRTEQGSITVDKGLFDFYKDYFDGIVSFEKE